MEAKEFTVRLEGTGNDGLGFSLNIRGDTPTQVMNRVQTHEYLTEKHLEKAAHQLACQGADQDELRGLGFNPLEIGQMAKVTVTFLSPMTEHYLRLLIRNMIDENESRLNSKNITAVMS